MNTKQVLINARAIIVRGWCQGTMAINKDLREVDPTDRTAKYFCIVGAIFRSTPDEQDQKRAFAALECTLGTGHIGDWNDDIDRTKAEVLDILDRAIISAL